MNPIRPRITGENLKEFVKYEPESGAFTWLKSRGKAAKGRAAGSLNRDGYLRICIDGVRYSAHCLAWLYVKGTFPEDQIDHINGIRSDNRICNLRLATRSQNQCNSRRNSRNKSGYKGVHWSKHDKVFRASIEVNGKKIGLGAFHDAISAHAAYCVAAKKYFGEFARLS